VKNRRGFTLLEMIVATTILGIAVVGLMAGLAGVTRNAARLREYDRAAQLAKLRMNDLLADYKVPRNQPVGGQFAPEVTGGSTAGWNALVTTVEVPRTPIVNDFALDRVDLEIWWTTGEQRRSFKLEGYRRRLLTPEDQAGAR
jgi:general secretion pathway protein I